MAAVPPSERDILIRLDEKVANGFANLAAKFDALERRQDGHEGRIKAVEIELGDRQGLKLRFYKLEDTVDGHADDLIRIDTTAKNIKTAVNVGWLVFGTAILGAIGKMLGLY